MSEGAIPIKKAIPIIVVAWILSLVTALALVYVGPSIFPIKTTQISDDAVTADKIADSAIITAKLADGTVTSAKILDGTITAVDIADGGIITVEVANGTITTAKIADDAVTTDKIADGAVLTVNLADGSVTSAKILNGAVTMADLATGAVTEIKIIDGAVTTDKIADEAVTDVKLAAGAIPHNVTYSIVDDSTSSTTFVDMDDMSVGINITRNSTLLIMFSAEVYITGTGTYCMYWRAMVNDTVAYPDSDWIRIENTTDPSTHSYIFYSPNVVEGTYTVKIQWKMFDAATTGNVDERTLTVIALPA